MKLNLNDKLDYTVVTKDNLSGKLTDLLFDDQEWKIRYLDVQFGGTLLENRKLIPVERIAQNDWKKEEITLDFNADKLQNMPLIEQKKTVSREMEIKILKHLKTEEYWGRRFIPSVASTRWSPDTLFVPRQNKNNRVPNKVVKEDDINTNLRSFNEIIGYEVFAKNGKVGLVTDLLIESKSWEIISIVIKAITGVGEKQEVIVASNWIEEVSFVEKRISLTLKNNEVLNAPEFNVFDPVNEKKVIRKMDYTGKPINKA
jgi:sporulation protein YlmC with PRC-barrel domain